MKKERVPRLAVSVYNRALTNNAIPVNGSTASTALGPLPRTTKVDMIYSQFFTLSTSLGITQTHVFSINGLFDADITSGGHQPLGFDQLIGASGLYDDYLVIYTKATVLITNHSGSESARISLRISNGSSTASDPNRILENRYVKVCTAGPRASGSNAKSLDIEVNPNKFLGSPNPMSDPTLVGTASTNPGQEGFLHVTAWPSIQGLAQSMDLYCQIRLEYTTILKNPRNPPTS